MRSKFSIILKFIIFFLLANISVLHTVWGQHEKGILPFRNFTTKEYNGLQQNWDIVQDHRGLMYFANNMGILEYDGVNWRTIEITTNANRTRSLDIDKKGRIYVGARDEFGYLKPDSVGTLQYRSLIDKLDSANLEFGNVWKTICTDEGIYFQAKKKVFLWDGKKIKVFHAKDKIHRSFFIDGIFYATIKTIGLTRIKGDLLVPVKGGKKFLYNNTSPDIFDIIRINNKFLLLTHYKKNLFLYSFNKGKSISKLAAFPSYLDSSYIINIIQNGIYINDNKISIGTYGKGLLIIDKKGKLLQTINKNTGLQDEIVFKQYLDRQGNLWLALSNGITKIKINSQLSSLKEESGLESTIESVARFNNKLYIATHLGIYQSCSYSNNSDIDKSIDLSKYEFSRFKNIDTKELTKECWHLCPFYYKDDSLLLVSSNRAYQLDAQHKVDTIMKEGAPWVIYQSAFDPARIYIGMEPGLATLYRENGEWTNEIIIKEINEIVFNISEDSDGNLWLGTLNGTIRIDKPVFNDSEIVNPVIKHYYEEKDIPNGPVVIAKFQDKLLFGTSKGLFEYDKSSDKFIKDNSFGLEFNNTIKHIHRLEVDKKGNVWMITIFEGGKIIGIEYIKPSSDSTKIIHKTVYLTDSKDIVFAIHHDKNGLSWIGGTNGLYCYDNSSDAKFEQEFSIFIRTVIADTNIIFGGTNFDEEDYVVFSQPDFLIPTLKYANNSLIFKYAALNSSSESALKYSYFLEGSKEKSWSDWTLKTEKEYTFLREGTYRFRVRAKDIYGNISKEAVYEFTILPPWYRTILAYILYIIFFIAFVYGAIQISTRGLQKIIRERTAEIREQKDLIEEKNKDIMDSIKYARRIQQTILPSDKNINKYLPDNFVLYKPRDIVSGDFYWMMHRENITIIAAADCTGHGVPGAFMSIMGVTFLNEVAAKKDVNTSAEVLNQLRANIIGSLGQHGEEGATKDGMDIALLAFHMDEMKVQYSGAYNPLYLIRDGELLETKPNRMPVGLHQRDKEPFTNHIIDIKKGDVMYIFSDGYIDQFGGPKGKKFMSKKFKELLMEIHKKPMEEQKEILTKRNLEWRGEIEQVDDIIVIGIRV